MKFDYSQVNYASIALVNHKPETEEDAERGFKVGSWSELSCFRCCLCPYDTLSEQDIKTHVFHKHTATATQVATRPISAVLYDPAGELVKEISDVHEGSEPQAEILEESLLAGLEEVMKKGLIDGKN